jgi:predicted permease
MSRLDGFRHRLSVLFRPRRYARELAEELHFHLELEAMQQRHAGAEEDEAGFAARRYFGNVTYYGEESRRMTALPTIDALVQDVRYACRTLRRSPGFTLAVVLTLALGIGANTAIFSVVNRLLLNPLPYEDADRIVFLGEAGTRDGQVFHHPPRVDLIQAWAAQARSLEGMESDYEHAFLETGAGAARVVVGDIMTPGFPAFFGVRPLLGRTFVSTDTALGAPPVVLISEASWRRDFGASPDVIGRTIALDSMPHTIIGVMPARWNVLNTASNPEIGRVWLPLSFARSRGPTTPRLMRMLARLRPGVSAEQARHELDTIALRVPDTGPFSGERTTASVLPPGQHLVASTTRSALLVLLAAVGLVLLVACANVANLLLARGTARAREVALRTALGASRWRLVRHVLTESIVLSLAGGVLGVGLAWLGLHVITTLRPDELTTLASVRVDPLVLQFTLALSLATGVLFGLVPALQTTSPSRSRVLQSSGSGVVRRESGGRFRAVLVGGEMALSVVLLVSAGLLIRSVVFLQHRDIGFDARNLVSMTVTLPPGRYHQPSSQKLFGQQLLEGVRAIPGVAAATQAAFAPPNYAASNTGPQARGRPTDTTYSQALWALNQVRPDYFHTTGIRMLAGRTFTEAEIQAGNAVIVDEALARHFWPGGSAIGQQLRMSSRSPWLTVVGVVADVSANGLMFDTHDPQLYLPSTGAPTLQPIGAPPQLRFIFRATSDPAPVIAAIRQLCRSIDPGVAVSRVDFVESELAASIAGPRFNMALLTVFAGLALALAAVGLAAVIGYAVSERTHEIGIRMALGAREGNVLRLVVTQGMRAVIGGLAAGVAGALAATRLLSSMLYGVEPSDPITFAAVVLLLAAVALVASWLPARRATRVDPVIALRAE